MFHWFRFNLAFTTSWPCSRESEGSNIYPRVHMLNETMSQYGEPLMALRTGQVYMGYQRTMPLYGLLNRKEPLSRKTHRKQKRVDSSGHTGLVMKRAPFGVRFHWLDKCQNNLINVHYILVAIMSKIWKLSFMLGFAWNGNTTIINLLIVHLLCDVTFNSVHDICLQKTFSSSITLPSVRNYTIRKRWQIFLYPFKKFHFIRKLLRNFRNYNKFYTNSLQFTDFSFRPIRFNSKSLKTSLICEAIIDIQMACTLSSKQKLILFVL